MSTSDKEPIIRSFRIFGLHGYKDVVLDFHGPARIVIAENGTGKTTILSALYAFLCGDFEKLKNLSFDRIECDFQSGNSSVCLQQNQLPNATDGSIESKLSSLAEYGDVEKYELRKILREVDLNDISTSIYNDTVLNLIYSESPYSRDDLSKVIHQIRTWIDANTSDELLGLEETIRDSIKNHDILYLPTYRRIELPLSKNRKEGPSQEGRYWSSRKQIPNKHSWNKLGIQFGLSDVEERISRILNQIQAQSNIGYRRISANIIDELLNLYGRIGASEAGNLPDINSLELFFSRIEQTRNSERRLEKIKELYETGNINSVTNDTLRYFLTKLSRVVEQTRELEANIESFVEKANTYLSMSSDEKSIHYDASSMKVLVENIWTKAEVKLDNLSSGEKQVVSLLAHLYLYPSKKIVLIDEPELSLSIDWQKRLLPDVLDSPKCMQLLAITHSPFIFDNELDSCAGPLIVSRKKNI